MHTCSENSMSDQLGTYLNDHLAGSTIALDLLSHLLAGERGPEEMRSLTELRDEISSDQKELQHLI